MSDLNNTIYLKDYSPTPYQIDNTELTFELGDGETIVTSTLTIKRRPDADETAALVLAGEALTLLSVKLNDAELPAEAYQVDEQQLVIRQLPTAFQLTLITRIHPEQNTELSGLYQSNGVYCTQCEAEGFRRITYYYDRPDVMATFSTRIIADPQHYPVMLSNGNLTDKGTLQDGRHWVLWQDPFPKPSYLFALVAGDLAHIHDQFTTASGKPVDLYIYTEHHNIDQCDHAMQSLKKAMRWDEEVYGREYDLDIYMIVAVDDFNMGAMENKGLNVFNTRFVLARPDTATDTDYQNIEAVIAHEYFHNWSGNRVTCRDWFQLSLKEGFTVFRDQEFSADMQSRGVKRIEDINLLRTFQFREDSSPMAHPVRPASYVEINNFYTLTVYEKGATVIRMLHLLLGKQGFRQGTDLYFDRHDGQAVTTDDFVKAMEDANQIDLTQFKRWYSQAGTPELSIQHQYDPAQQTLTLTVQQNLPDTPGQTNKQPMLIPLSIALLDSQGQPVPLMLDPDDIAPEKTKTLSVTESEQRFVFYNIKNSVTPSLLRDFSAPVKLTTDLSDDQRYFLMTHDSDHFVRWDAGQTLFGQQILHLAQQIQQGQTLQLDQRILPALEKLLNNGADDKAMQAMSLTLPSETYLSSFMHPIDPIALHQAREFMRNQISMHLRQTLLSSYLSLLEHGEFKNDAASMAQRRLKNLCLSYLMQQHDSSTVELAEKQFYNANNMTDVLAALQTLVNADPLYADSALESFYDKWSQESLVVDKWLSLQATSKLPGTLARVKQLTRHPAFKLNNPNKVRALIGAFCSNAAHFHDLSGEGYQFLSEYIIQLDQKNPQIAARLVTPLQSWRKYDDKRQQLMRAELEKIVAQASSKDVYEVVSKALSD